MKAKFWLAVLVLALGGLVISTPAEAITFRAAASTDVNGSSLTLTITVPTGTVQGDVMIAGVAVLPSTATITPPAGWTLVRRQNNALSIDNSLAVYWKVAGASEPASYTWSFNTSTGSAGGIQSFSGVEITNPVNVEAGSSTTAATNSFPAPSVTTTVANTMVVTHHAYASSTRWIGPTGMTEAVTAASNAVNNTAGEAIEGNYKAQATIATIGPFTATLNLAGIPTGQQSNYYDNGNMHTLVLNPACPAVADAGYVAATAQNGQVTIYWSSPNPVVILQKTATFLATDAPTNYKSYAVNASVGTATVGYNGTTAVAGMTCTATSCTQTGLTNGTTYYYKVFANTTGPCYAPGTVNTTAGVVARPASGAGYPTWSYTLAGGSILKGGTASGTGTLYATSNASWIVSLQTAGGTQSWTPLASNAPIQAWLTWLPVGGYKYRRNIPITAGTAVVPLGYSASLIFDHASLVTAGKSRADGNDVRVLYWNGSTWTQLDRVLDSGSSWNTSTTKIWFKTQAAIGAGASDTNYYLYYGNLGATNPPANKANVFLFADDFEAGNLSNWTVLGGLWQIATDRPRSGTYSLKYPAEAAADQWILANPALNEANVYVDAWWNFSVLDPLNGVPNIAQVFRADAAANGYETNLEGQSETREGWDMAKFISGTGTLLNTDTISTAAANAWTRIGIAISGTGMRIFKDGVQVNPATGSFNVGTQLTSGNVGFRKDDTGTGAWWIDDVVARRYVDPEPTTALGVEQANADGSVIGADQGTGAANTGTLYSGDPVIGTMNWQVTLTGADQFQAAPGAQVRQWSDAAFQAAYTDDVIFAATLNTLGAFTTNNKVFALGASNGALLWTFSGTMDGVVGMPWVDYARNRIYVTSRAGSGGTQQSLWVIKTVDGEGVLKGQAMSCSLCSTLGHLEVSPTLSFNGLTLYVGNTAGTLYAIDATGLTLKWSLALGTAIKGFVWEDYVTTGRLYFAAGDGTVWCIQDNGASGSACTGWTSPSVPGPSTPLELGKLFVGAWDLAAAVGQKGKLYQINLTTGAVEKTVVVGDGEKQPGDVSTETGNEIFVGTTEGVIYKFPLTGGSL